MHLEYEKNPIVSFGISELKKVSTESIQSLILKKVPIGFKELKEEGYYINNDSGKFTISAIDDKGLFYALIDLKNALICDCVSEICDRVVNPSIEKRGIKFNIPLDARTPSYSDSSDSARKNIENMWDFSFWKIFLDRLACYKYNMLSLWSLHPFPSMVKLDKYPEMALDDVMKPSIKFFCDTRAIKMYESEMERHLVRIKRMTIDEKIAFWNRVFSYAKDRGIEIYICTWNIFLCGVQNMNPKITLDQQNDVTIDYFKESVKTLFLTYPDLKGIGVTSGENMDDSLENDYENEKWLYKTYYQGIKEALEESRGREITFIHRVHMTDLEKIESLYEPIEGLTFDYSYKYSKAHMYGAIKPNYGDSFFLELSKLKSDRKTLLTVRNDDYYLFRHGSVDFARAYLENMPHEVLKGFYIGPDGFTWGLEYVSKNPPKDKMQTVEKMWYDFMIWGTLSYQLDKPKSFYRKMLIDFYEEDIYEAIENASNILIEVNRMHYHQLDFQWYPEACVCNTNTTSNILFFQDVKDFADTNSAEGSNYVSIKDYVNAISQNIEVDGITPLEGLEKLSDFISRTKDALDELPLVEKAETKALINDIEGLVYLGEYYKVKLKMGLLYKKYEIMNDKGALTEAYEISKVAYRKWEMYASHVNKIYRPQYLNRMLHMIDIEDLKEFVYNDCLFLEDCLKGEEYEN